MGPLTGKESSSSPNNNKKSFSNGKLGELDTRRRSTADRNPSIRRGIHELGLVCKARNKAVMPEKEEEDFIGDFHKQLGEKGKLDNGDDDCEFNWLSSGTSSPSSCFDHHKSSIFFDGSRLNQVEEASLDGERISSDGLLMSLVGNNFMDSNERWELERKGLWDSLVNLDGEESKWIADSESEWNWNSIQSGFPSPSYKSSSYGNSEVQSSNASVCLFSEVTNEKSNSFSSSGYVSEDVELAKFVGDEPIFWPFDRKFDWNSEGKWDFFVMSPRKHKDGIPKGNSVTKELKHTNGTKDGMRMKSTPSRLGKSRTFSMKIVPLDAKDDTVEPNSEKILCEESLGKYTNFMVEDFATNEELPLEFLLGLEEFDGHEGIESEFNKDDFSLERSLSNNQRTVCYRRMES